MCRLAALAGLLQQPLVCAQADIKLLDASLVEEFQQLWTMVVVNQESRNVPQGEGPPIRRACQFGMSENTLDLARFLLAYADPPLEELEINDLVESTESSDMISLARQLEDEFGTGRVRIKTGLWKRQPGPSHEDGQEICDLVLFSKVSHRFSVDRILPRVGSHVVAVWVSDSCIHETGDKASPECSFLNTFWEKTYLMMRGYCSPRICVSRVLKNILQDPNVLSLDCDRFGTSSGSNDSISEFGQDWFALENFIRPEDGRQPVYVDIGASLPFDYSNTVMFDRCLGWRGVCVEPNPHLNFMLAAYRSCQIFPNCVEEEGPSERPFADRDGNLEFYAECLSLTEILRRAGLEGERVDVMSIDVEHQELAVLKGIDFDLIDVRVFIIEVSRGARWLEVDTILLPQGYAKVAVLGRDVVYVKLEELRSKQLADWQLLLQSPPSQPQAILPEGWLEMHQRVVDDELEEEMRRERKAYYDGLRRPR